MTMLIFSTIAVVIITYSMFLQAKTTLTCPCRSHTPPTPAPPMTTPRWSRGPRCRTPPEAAGTRRTMKTPLRRGGGKPAAVPWRWRAQGTRRTRQGPGKVVASTWLGVPYHTAGIWLCAGELKGLVAPCQTCP